MSWIAAELMIIWGLWQACSDGTMTIAHSHYGLVDCKLQVVASFKFGERREASDKWLRADKV